MRRHKDSMLNGQRLLNLPPKTSEVVELEFTPEEREIYNAIEQRMKIRFGQFLQQGELNGLQTRKYPVRVLKLKQQAPS